MGQIADLDFPHAFPRVKARSPRVATVPRPETREAVQIRAARETGPSIVVETPLVPRAAAEAVWEEARELIGEELPRQWIALLIEKSEAIYARRGDFRRRLRGGGASGREWLWSFMRHWLAALVLQHRPGWYARLPARYAVGEGSVPERS